jgi:hypothetical protein
MKDILLPLIATRSGWIFRQLLKGVSIVSASLTTWLMSQGVDDHTTGAIVAGVAAALSWGAEFGLSKLARHIATPCLALACLLLTSCSNGQFLGMDGKAWGAIALETGKTVGKQLPSAASQAYANQRAKIDAKQPVNVQPVGILPENPPAEQNGWLNSLLNLIN